MPRVVRRLSKHEKDRQRRKDFVTHRPGTVQQSVIFQVNKAFRRATVTLTTHHISQVFSLIFIWRAVELGRGGFKKICVLFFKLLLLWS